MPSFLAENRAYFRFWGARVFFWARNSTFRETIFAENKSLLENGEDRLVQTDTFINVPSSIKFFKKEYNFYPFDFLVCY